MKGKMHPCATSNIITNRISRLYIFLWGVVRSAKVDSHGESDWARWARSCCRGRWLQGGSLMKTSGRSDCDLVQRKNGGKSDS